jgi:hypothetical protein
MQRDHGYEVRDKREVSFILCRHKQEGHRSFDPEFIRQYLLAVGIMDLKDQLVQSYLLERKLAKKEY